MNTFIIELDNRPGSLADVAAAIAEKGININGVAGLAGSTTGLVAIVTNDEDATRSALDGLGARYREAALASASLEDKPGTLADIARRLADAGVNIEAIFPTGMEGGRITVALGVDNIEAARSVIGQSASVGA
jgi:hypothetical protein